MTTTAPAAPHAVGDDATARDELGEREARRVRDQSREQAVDTSGATRGWASSRRTAAGGTVANHKLSGL